MSLKQFKCTDLKPGDILVKLSDQSWLSHVIENLQWLLGASNSQVTHTAIISEQPYTIEVQDGEIRANSLKKENRPYGYIVFRCKNKKLAEGAATFARLLADKSATRNNLRPALLEVISTLGTGKEKTKDKMGIEGQVDKLLTDQRHDFFGSQLVVFLYQFVAEQSGIKPAEVFNFKAPLVSPTLLTAHLVDSKTFDEVGYLMPNER